MFTRAFWLGDSGALVRAIRTAAQTALAALGVGQTNLFTADWKNVGALAASAAILSLLMSLDRREAFFAIPPGAQATVQPAEQPVVQPPVVVEQLVGMNPAGQASYGCGDSLR